MSIYISIALEIFYLLPEDKNVHLLSEDKNILSVTRG